MASSTSYWTPHWLLHSQESLPVFFNDAVSALPSTTCYPPHARYEQEYRRAATYLPNYTHYTPIAYFASSQRADLAAKRIQRVFNLLPEWLDKWRMGVNVSKTAALLTDSQRIMLDQLRLRVQAVE
ncbi:hypothetical protein EVAR_87427_1 [Eumeta japonica]|uniref:RNA-directed DNA polymerase from mobile element jockey n=1 Tax=Eumeta variegata TaxID=151549 RepID=A0A4C1XLF4_EUMVA|nr:hypothetical protein EVAR_87427_1 [Eumeta japonica]